MARREYAAADYAALLREYMEKAELVVCEADETGTHFWLDFRPDQPWIAMEHGSALIQIGLFGGATLFYAAPVPAIPEKRAEALEQVNNLNIDWHGQAAWSLDNAGDGWLLRAEALFQMDACSRGSARACAGEIRQTLAMITRQVTALGEELPELFGDGAMIAADMELANLDDYFYLTMPAAHDDRDDVPSFDMAGPEPQFHPLADADYALLVRALAFGAESLSIEEQAQLARAMDLSMLRGDKNYAALRGQLGRELTPVDEDFDPFAADPSMPKWLPEWGDENALLARHEQEEKLSGWELIILNEAMGRSTHRMLAQCAFAMQLLRDVERAKDNGRWDVGDGSDDEIPNCSEEI